VCPLSPPQNGYFKTLKYGTLHGNKNIVSFEIQILTKIRQSEIKSTILTSSTAIIASKCLERQKEGINGYIKGK